MMLDDETLMAYADGEHERAKEIEAALASRPMLAARVAEMRALRKAVSGAFAPIAEEPAPAYLAAMLTARRAARHVAPTIIKRAPVYPFIVLAAAAVALIAVIATEPRGAPSAPFVVASGADNLMLIPPVITPKPKATMLAPSASPFELAPLSPPPTPVYAEAIWLQQPDAQTIERYYPVRAAAQNIKGKVILDCRANADGSIDCTVASAEPDEWGFGEAAIAVARHFLIAEKAANGMQTADGHITIPIVFALRNCAASPSAIALGAVASSPLITAPVWLKKPSLKDMGSLYPQKALDLGRRGQVLVRCLIGLDGALTNCAVVSETPKGWGFGDAAIRMAQKFVAAPYTAKGEPTAGRLVSLPIVFKDS